VREIGRALVVVGCVTAVVGALLAWGPRIPFLGSLPGDVVVRRERFTVHLPVVSCLVVSILLTLLLNLFFRR